MIQANLADIGINLGIQTQDNATFNAIPGGGGGGPHRQLVYTLFTTQPDPSWSTVWFTSLRSSSGTGANGAARCTSARTTQPSRRRPSAPHAAVHPGAKGVGQGSQHGLDLNPTLTYSGKKSISPPCDPTAPFCTGTSAPHDAVKAAVLYQYRTPLVIEDLDLESPRAGEILVRMVASGVCHSDLHSVQGVHPGPMPAVHGHEGAGVVEEIGPE